MLGLALAGGAQSSQDGGAQSSQDGGQHVGGVVEPQFGVAVSPDGSIRGNSSTIPVDVTRTVENGVEVITITPAY